MAGRRIILGVAISLDGFIEGPNGEYDWCFSDQDYGMSAFMKRIDAIFMGRKSYEVAKKHEGPNPWKGIKTYVVSNTISELDDKDAVLLRGENLEDEIGRIKNSKGKDIWLFGGALLTTELMNRNLIDEFWLAVHPVVLGAGKPLFQNVEARKKLILHDSKVYNTGLVSLTYLLAPH
jgi:dihydrofolate reductase